MKRAAWLVLLLASCSSSDDDSRLYEKEPVGSYDPKLETDPKLIEDFRTHELGTDRTGSLSKTIEPQNGSTPDSSTYTGGEVVIDKVFREDAQDMFAVKVRLGNRSTSAQKLEYRIRFFDRNGVLLLGHHDDFRAMTIEPRGLEIVSDACRTHGAVGYQLYVRRQGTKDDGRPDALTNKPK